MPISALQNLLTQAPRAGIYRLSDSIREPLPETCAALGFAHLQTDLGETRALAGALAALGKDLGFPDWYGANLDALHDCLTDLSWLDASGYVLTISGADALRAADPAAFATLNAVFASAIEEWRAQGVTLWVFYDLPADALATLPTLA